MSTATPAQVLLGVTNQVRVVITEDEGNLLIQVYAEQPDTTDIDGLFFNLNNDADAPNLTIYPEVSDDIVQGNITGFDVRTAQIGQMNNGAQVNQTFDVLVEFGDVPSASLGDTDQAAFTLYVDGGPSGLTADSIDLSSITAVINSDGGNGVALTTGVDNSGGQVEMVTVVTEDFDGLHYADQSDLVVSDDHWDVRHGELHTDGCNDGTLLMAPVDANGPVELSFDARGINLHEFENGGHYGDSLRVEVQIDGGDWVLLDEFAVNDHGNALVGSETGQEITSSESTISYAGGVMDTATNDVQIRLVSDISAYNEQIRIDDIEIRTIELVDATAPTEPVETVVAEEDFDGLYYANQSDLVANGGDWDISHGQLTTDGNDDGWMSFEEVAFEGDASISFDARVPDTHRFENGGHYGDSLEVWALVDGTDWELLDTFEVNAQGTALVGDQTGQEMDANSQTITYEGGALDGAETVQLYFNSDISACDEDIFIDNMTFTDVVEAPVEGQVDEDFEAAQSGDVAFNQFDGFTVTAQRAGEDDSSENDAMVFDSANPTGGDHDLGYADQGNILIISEDNDSSDADDNANGGTFSFDFDEESEISSLTVLDIEEAGGSIDLYDVNEELITSIEIPAAGDNSAQEIDINVAGVSSMDVHLVGSGAIDDLSIIPASATAEGGEYDVTYDDLFIDKPEDDVEEDEEDQTTVEI